MADQQDDKTKLPVTSILALVAVVSGLLVSQIPLKTSRPIGKEAESHVFVGADRVQSRLWQDPFEAVDDHLKKERARLKEHRESGHHHGLKNLAGVIHSLAPDNSSFTMMPVMVNGSPYSNGIESRLRHRYALVSALGASEYIPEAAEYVRFFRWKPKSCEEPPCLSIVVPVEWYKPKPSLGVQARQVLIIWIKAQDFSGKPLARLAQLVEEFQDHFDPEKDQFKILGPRGSGGLAAMVQEVEKPSDTLAPLKGVEIFSSWATAEDTFLIGDSPRDSSDASTPSSKITKIENLFTDASISLVRTMGTDAVLAEQLIKELELRQVDVTKPCSGRECPHHVALISEWDSLYGRVLPRTFVAVAKNKGQGKTSPELTKEINVLRQDEWPLWAHHYSYLAGLDGELPPKEQGKGTSAGSTKDKVEEKILRTATGMELPIGRGQLDYVRRLAKTLQDAEADIPGGYKAIGVLGSDVYDKLLILQALRPSFPQAIFFTTDLDSRLAHPDQLPWTRNLIITSHFGLELPRDQQEPIPPFRDAYQTALFFSVLKALKDPSHRIEFVDSPPRVYEIGRHGPFDLSALVPPGPIHSIHPMRPDLDPHTGYPRRVNWVSTLKIGGILLFILLCAVLVSSQVWDGFVNLRASWRFWIAIGLALAIVIGLTRWAISDGADGDPFVVTDGISVWPSQVIRLLAFFLCGGFFLYSGWSLRTNEGGLKRTFHLPDLPKPPLQESGFHRFIGIHRWNTQPKQSTTIQQIWLDYLRLGRWPNRWMRYSLQAVLYLAFGVLLMKVFGFPNTPCRGPACFSINFAILVASVLGMVLLIFFVVDATRLCRRFINHLVEEPIEWPEEFLHEKAKKRGVHTAFVQEWLGIDLIAQRTEVIGRLIYYPFFVLFLMYVARHSYFDRWDFPVGLVIILTLNVAYAFGNALGLRWSAEQAKKAAIAQLRAKLYPLSDLFPSEEESKHQIERAIEAIKNNREGAFLPFTAHPIFGAIALPSGGFGVLLLMEHLSNAF